MNSFDSIFPQRPNYFPGQYLLETDFELQHNYLASRLRYLRQSMYTAGVVEGLEVIAVAGQKQVKITAGTAIDSLGNLLVCQTDSLFNVSTSGDLFIQWQEKQEALQDPNDQTSFTRWTEASTIQLAASTPPGAVTLAKLTLSGNQVTVDFSTRQSSALKLPSPGGNLSLRYQGNFQKPAGNAPETAVLSGSLSVTGNVGIGTTTTVTEKLEVNGNIKATNATLTGTLSVTQASTLNGQVTVQPALTATSANATLTAVHIKPTFTLTPANLTGVKQNGLIVESGNVGIGTTSPVSKLTIGNSVANTTGNTAYEYGNAQLSIFEPNHNGGSTPNGTRDILNLVRTGVDGQAWGNKVSLAIGRYENSGLNSRTQLDIKLTDGSFDSHNTVMSLRSNGNVGIGTTTPGAKLDVAGGLQLRNGGPAGQGYGGNQILLGDGNASASHVIKSRHSTGTGGGNAIDFYLWDPAIDTNRNQIGTRSAMILETMDGAGCSLTLNGNLSVQGTTSRVGIGTTTPTTDKGITLDIVGGIRIRRPGNLNRWLDIYWESDNVICLYQDNGMGFFISRNGGQRGN
jgi:hypothetical protein